MKDKRLRTLIPLLAYFGEPDVEIFDDYDRIDDLCSECGEVLENGICPNHCEELKELIESVYFEEEFADDLDGIGHLGCYEDDIEFYS